MKQRYSLMRLRTWMSHCSVHQGYDPYCERCENGHWVWTIPLKFRAWNFRRLAHVVDGQWVWKKDGRPTRLVNGKWNR